MHGSIQIQQGMILPGFFFMIRSGSTPAPITAGKIMAEPEKHMALTAVRNSKIHIFLSSGDR